MAHADRGAETTLVKQAGQFFTLGLGQEGRGDRVALCVELAGEAGPVQLVHALTDGRTWFAGAASARALQSPMRHFGALGDDDVGDELGGEQPVPDDPGDLREPLIEEARIAEIPEVVGDQPTVG
jgi:hypothetical protein